VAISRLISKGELILQALTSLWQAEQEVKECGGVAEHSGEQAFQPALPQKTSYCGIG
jgi:hypothetical protein